MRLGAAHPSGEGKHGWDKKYWTLLCYVASLKVKEKTRGMTINISTLRNKGFKDDGIFKDLKIKPEGFGSSIIQFPWFQPSNSDKSMDLALSNFSNVKCISDRIINAWNVKQTSYLCLLLHTFLYDQLAEVAFLPLDQEYTNCNQIENAFPFPIKQ